MAVRFRLLGPVEAEVDGRQIELGHAKQRCVLAALLVDVDRIVPVDVLLDRVWAHRLPRNGRVTLSGYISRLRHLLAAVDDVSLTREADGYRLAVDPMSVDLHRFRTLVARAGAATSRDEGTALLTEALASWRGPAFATVDAPWLNDLRDQLASERLTAELDRNDLVLDQGRPMALVTELSVSVTTNPWDERLAGQLMLALYRCGRQTDALHRYELLRSQLAEEFGVDPSPPLQQLHQRILRADHTLAVNTTVPRQLPAPPASFTGRTHQLARLEAIRNGSSSTAAVVAVTGTAGVGKTALALQWAHQVAHEYPDGQLYVNLRGFDPDGSVPCPAETAILGFLDGLGVAPHRVPGGLDEQSALYRSTLAGRRMLVVLDNARDVAQIQPLLPGTPGCLVLVTSRNQLTGLIAGQAAHPVTLDLLNTEEARDLLACRLGAQRVAAEPSAVDKILDRCAGLPLALTIVAARSATHPHFPLRVLASELHNSHSRLDALTDADPRADVRAVFSWSCDTLSPASARLFRLLGLHPGPDFAAPAAASLAAVPLTQLGPLLAELTRAHLLTQHVPGRYAYHDLLRAYATEQAHLHEPASERHDAAQRMHDHYVHTAHSATRLIDPYQGDPPELAPAGADVVRECFAGKEQAASWFTAEFPVLLAAIDHAALCGLEQYTWSLAWALSEYSYRRGHWLELGAAFLTALRSAELVGDQRGRAHALRGLGITEYMRNHHHEAIACLRHALKVYDELGDHVAQADVLHAMCVAADKNGHPEDALDYALKALALRGTGGDRIARARTLNCVGWCHLALGNHRIALPYLDHSLTLLRGADDWPGLAMVWDSIGYAHHHLGQYHRAVECYQHALQLDWEAGNSYCQAEVLVHLGDTRHAAGDQDRAGVAWLQALAVYDELDHRTPAEAVRAKLCGIGVEAPSMR